VHTSSTFLHVFTAPYCTFTALLYFTLLHVTALSHLKIARQLHFLPPLLPVLHFVPSLLHCTALCATFTCMHYQFTAPLLHLYCTFTALLLHPTAHLLHPTARHGVSATFKKCRSKIYYTPCQTRSARVGVGWEI
jgi:hypothetical protein